ncbi:MAG: pyridoxal-phosphate dependent enzyme [Candidatus Marinimicrobia bacterium]|nr:pyridoxal-phosphate dependent enzyme [Candidatus Neomarinimicrobiota bacterium]
MINRADLLSAHQIIKGLIHNTPVLTAASINAILEMDLYFKCENLQKVGAFKIRGATHAVFTLSQTEMKFGVATHSSGNHAAALALAARWKKIPAEVVMPISSPRVKVEAVRGYGANITFCEPNQEARESTLNKILEKTGATFIHPYNNEKIIAGQSTAALEMLEKIPNLEYLITPVGGGGLLSGTLLACQYFYPHVRVIGAEPQGADDAFRSLQQNRIIPSISPKTIADGLLTSLGSLTFPIIQQYVDKIITVKETSIIQAMRMVWERMKIIIEPSSAVPMAAVLENRDFFQGKRIGIILSGGNVDLGKLPFNSGD